MTIRPVEAELFYADGLTDMTKLIVAFLRKRLQIVLTVTVSYVGPIAQSV